MNDLSENGPVFSALDDMMMKMMDDDEAGGGTLKERKTMNTKNVRPNF